MRQHYLRAAAGYRINQSTDDQYIANTELLLKGEGTNGQTNNTFVDSSASSHTITRNGDTTQGSFSPFSPKGWSGYFDSTNDALSLSASSDFVFGTGDFTWECWFNRQSGTPNSGRLVQIGPTWATNSSLGLGVYGSNHSTYPNKIFVYAWNLQQSTFIQSSITIADNEWHHVAVTRNNGVFYLYVDGVLRGSNSNYSGSVENVSTNTLHIGGEGASAVTPSSENFLRYISNARIVKGTALYTAAFTPPTEPLTAVTNTKLLTLQDNRFIDNSASNHSITVNGEPAIKPTSPFSGDRTYPKASYFSGKFDGSNDYLEVEPESGTYFNFASGGFNSTSLSGFTHGPGSNSSSQVAGPSNGYYVFTNAQSYSGGYIVDNTARQYDKDFSITCKIAPQGNYFPDGFCVSLNDNASTIGTRGVMVPPANGGRQIWFHIVNWFGPQPPYQTMWLHEETTGTQNLLATADSNQGTYAGTGTAGYFGGTQYWWWDYEHSTGTHKIYHSTSSTKPSTARVTATFTMPSTPLHAYIGGGTGGANTEWRLLEWAAEAPSPTADDFAFGTGDFTVDAWVYPQDINTTSGSNYTVCDFRTTQSNHYVGYIHHSTNNFRLANGSSDIASTTIAQNNQWYHLAFVKDNGTCKLFVNGVLENSSSSLNATAGANRGLFGVNYNSQSFFSGYISNLRVIKGTALYTTAFTPPTAPLTPVTNTKLLTLQDNYLVDHSPSGHSITNNGGVTLEPESPFSNSTYPLSGTFYSGYFDGTNDNLTIPDNSAFDLSSGDFTVEGWIKPLSNSDTMYFGQWLGWGWFFGVSQGTLQFASYDGSYHLENSGVAPSTYYNKWTHIAATREGNTLRIFVNGEKKGGDHTLSHTFTNSSGNFEIGSNTAGVSQYYNGYISNVRIVKGTALYTSDFTVPTEPLTAVSGTTLLTLQDATIQDNSASSHSITNNGATVTEIAPFGAALIDRAGSMYFDGNGDYLRCDAALDSFTAANDPFTIEAWFYCNSVDSSVIESIFGVNYNNGQSNNLMVSVRNVSGTPNIWLHYLLSGSNQIDAAQGAFSLHTWNHIAASYDGTTFRLYLNGSQLYSTTGTPSNSFDGCAFCVGAELDATNVAGNYFDGYITDVRIVKSALYTLNFTPSTAPLQPITNTKLLLSGNNGGVEDSLGKVNLFTHPPSGGSAQIDTSVKKFGTGSIQFDGSNDYLLVKHDPRFSIESGNFTIEGWYYRIGTGRHSIINKRPSSGNSGFELRIEPSSVNNNPVFYFAGGSSFGTINYSMPSNQWVYIAVVRSGSNAALFVDGQRKASSSSWADGTSNTQSIWMGHSAHNSSDYLNGYLDDFRLTKGVARYDPTQTSHTVPTKTHPTI